MSDTETSKRCSSRGWAGLWDKNNEFIAVPAATGLHISASISDQNHPTKGLFKCGWWRTATNTARQAFFYSYLLQMHQPAVPMLRVRSRHSSGQAVDLLRCCRMSVVHHLVLYDLPCSHDSWLMTQSQQKQPPEGITMQNSKKVYKRK